ncbi:MAG: DNA primase [Clostridiales Family XIII bacterium]|jgi:DNA primase|nr:DNA primase [Clostridiales Family XIII bacterium]
MSNRTENIVDEIKHRCNIVDVIGGHVKLRKAGANYKGLCPFHNEKTPSFVVSEEKQIFTCFGCGVSGNVIEFVKRINNFTFMEAVSKLAEDYGIDVGAGIFDNEKKRAVYYEANKKAAVFFYKAFRSQMNPALAYMAGRGIDDATLRKFGVGYADAAWDSLYTQLKNDGVEEGVMVELGLVSASNKGFFDKFRGRVIFPILNTRSKVIGFGGRVLGDGMPKYLNSQDSKIYHKKDSLYALNVTRQDISKEDQAILVEGYMDAISLYRHGVKNVAASLGTALTKEQAERLKRYTGNIVIAYDSDAAGNAAAMRGMDILREAGCSVRVLRVKGAKDPDEFIKAYGRERFLELVGEAVPMIDFKLMAARERADMNTTEGSLSFLKAAAAIIKPLSPVEAEVYIKKAAAETGISEGAMRGEIQGGGQSGGHAIAAIRARRRPAAEEGGAADPLEMVEKYFIRLMLLEASYMRRVHEYEEAFVSPAAYRIYSNIKSLYEEDEEIDLSKLTDILDINDRAVLEDILQNIKIADKGESVFAECVQAVKLSSLAAREDEVLRMLTLTDEDENNEKAEQLSCELLAIQKKRKEVRGW